MDVKLYDNNYGTNFKSNAMSIIIYKSKRKNSISSDFINVNHLITQTKNRKLTDDSIINQFVNTIDKLVHESLQFNGNLELSAYITVFKNEHYQGVTQVDYHKNDDIRYSFNRNKFYSLEQCINFVFSLYYLIYPYNTISLSQGVYTNSSIKHIINKYYGKTL